MLIFAIGTRRPSLLLLTVKVEMPKRSIGYIREFEMF